MYAARIRHADGSIQRGWELFNTRARHDVVALACQTEQSINSGNAMAIDQADIQTNMSAFGRFPVTSTTLRHHRSRLTGVAGLFSA
jgi:hypothetical protein